MLPTGKKDTKTAIQIILYTIWTLVTSLIPMFGMTGDLYLTPVAGALILILGIALLWFSIRLYKKRDAKTAKELMLASVIYITLLQIVYVADKFIR